MGGVLAADLLQAMAVVACVRAVARETCVVVRQGVEWRGVIVVRWGLARLGQHLERASSTPSSQRPPRVCVKIGRAAAGGGSGLAAERWWLWWLCRWLIPASVPVFKNVVPDVTLSLAVVFEGLPVFCRHLGRPARLAVSHAPGRLPVLRSRGPFVGQVIGAALAHARHEIVLARHL